MKIIRFLVEKIFQFILTIVMIGFIVALSVALQAPRGEILSTLVDQLQLYVGSLVYVEMISVQVAESNFEQLTTVMKEPYQYSLLIMGASLVCSILIALVISFTLFLLSERIRKIVHECLYFLQSIPDVMFIFATQLFLIWIYKKTNIIILDPIAGLEKVFALPIIVVSIVPGIMLSQMAMIAIEEEQQKTYVEYAKAKGLSMRWILLNHIFRNVLVTLFSNIQFIFWFLLSNLLVVEYLFNTRGFFNFMYNMNNFDYIPEAFFVCLTYLFVPFYLFDVLAKIVVIKLSGKEQI